MKKTASIGVDVIIPVYRPDKRFRELLDKLAVQTVPVRKIIIMNTERSYWKDSEYQDISNLEVHHVTRTEFDHGGTRRQGAGYSKAAIMIFMTDDAIPEDEHLLEHLVKALTLTGPGGESMAAAYARQLPAGDCRFIERLTRAYNYPPQSRVKTAADLKRLGIKTFMASNVCCAYRRDIYEELGGFIPRTVFNEDMIYAAGAVKAGYGVAYAAKARVIHSHNLTGGQQFHRNFDLAVSQAEHPEVFEKLPSEGEGLRLVKETAIQLVKTGHMILVPELAVVSGCKYAGYWLGKRYRSLPLWLVKACAMNKNYWNRKGGKPV